MAFARQVTIAISNASGATLNIGYSTLTGGGFWEPPGPTPGTPITPGGPPTSFVNGVGDTFSSLGGTLVINPASGGQITIGWGWAQGSGYTSSSTGTSLNGIGVSSLMSGTQSNQATLQVTVVNAAAFEAAREGIEKAKR
jgi:hypothetical protein